MEGRAARRAPTGDMPEQIRPGRTGAAAPAALLLAAVFLTALLGRAAWAQSLDDRVYVVARQLMCPVCAGQTVAESDATVAREMRAVIREKLLAGETPDQILRFFVGQFGESVLAEPPRRGVSLVLYLGPPAALIAGLAIAAAVIRRWARTPPAGPQREPVRPAAGPPVDPQELERLARELEARDR